MSEIQSIPITFASTGIVLRNSPDEIPITSYKALINLISDRENTLAVRHGFTRLQDGLPDDPYSFAYLKDNSGQNWRYAVAGNALYVAGISPSSSSFSAVTGGGSLSSAADPRAVFSTYTLFGTSIDPYLFLADGTRFIRTKGGSDPARMVGITAPTLSATVSLENNNLISIESFDTAASFTKDNATDTISSVTGVTGNATQLDHLSGNPPGGMHKALPSVLSLDPTDLTEPIQFYVKFPNGYADRDYTTRMTVKLGLGVLNDTTFNNSFSYDITQASDPINFTTIGAINSWTLVKIPKNLFTQNGPDPTLGWGDVCALSIIVDASASVSAQFDEMSLATNGALTGVDLKWVFTYRNSVTGTESDFSPITYLTSNADLNQYTLTFPQNPSVTAPLGNPDQIRIYRQGGTITQFQLVATIPYVAGATPTYTDNVPDSALGEVLLTDNQIAPGDVRGVELYNDSLWVWGSPEDPPNMVRFSKPVLVENFPAFNYIFVGNSEKVMRCLEHDGELFVFTTTRVYRVVGTYSTGYRAVTTPVNKGIKSVFGVVRGDHALFVHAYDGVYEFPSGRKISEPINQIFHGEQVNGLPPLYIGQEYRSAMGFWDSRLYFSYPSQATAQNDMMVVWDTIYERWHFYLFGVQQLFTEPDTNILVGGTINLWEVSPSTTYSSGTYPMHLEDGFADQLNVGFRGIYFDVDTKEYDLGHPDQEKIFIDFVLDADTQNMLITPAVSFDEGAFVNLNGVSTAARARTILNNPSATGNSILAVKCGFRVSGVQPANATAPIRLYKLIHRILLEPMRHGIYVTDWSDYGTPGPKFFRELWIELDTFNNALSSIEVQLDQAVAYTINTGLLATNGRKRLYFGLPPDLLGNLGRLRVIPSGSNEVKVYTHSFQCMPEPTNVITHQTSYTDNGFPYKKLWKHVQLDINTNGSPVSTSFWVDGVIVETFNINTSFRTGITQSFNRNIFGKLGRITISDSATTKLYGDPIFATDNLVPDLTLSDSFEQILDYDRYKVLRRMWVVIANPLADVSMDIYIDNSLVDSVTIALDATSTTGYSKKRIDLPSALKGKLFRFVFTSSEKFDLHWEKTEIELKNLNTEDGYQRLRLNPPATF